MSFLQFIAPPLPHFIMAGEDTYPHGGTHPNRNYIGVFDILVVTKGSLYMCEGEVEWMVTPGKVLILRPDLHHYSFKPCTIETHFYWMHFQYFGNWSEISREPKPLIELQQDPFKTSYPFQLVLPKFCTLTNPWSTYEQIRQLLDKQTFPSTLWQQQILFHQIIMELHAEQTQIWNSQVYQLAEKTAAFLRENYETPITSEVLKHNLYFHPTYLARCMKEAFGCTPFDYLTDYRIGQSKILLINSDMSVQMIAQQVGFNSSTYFIRCFTKNESATPTVYRKKYRSESRVTI